MSSSELFFLTFLILGGLALFIFGMNIMSEGLRTVAGNGLRTLLTRTTANRFAGLGLGTLLGFLVHSSAASVMLVGFMNAGLLSLEQAVAPMLGTNLGTSLSMQLVSFKLTDYCYVGIALGLILSMVCPHERGKAAARALIGFGLLFLGMKTMSDALHPHREFLSTYLTFIDGHTLGGRLLGVGIALAITAVVQSSGAVIGMSFALADAEAFTSLWQIYPIIIGAQIGTCATALLGSIGTQIEARRAAVGNLGTNVVNAIVSITLAPLWIPLFAQTSENLVRQSANTHTLLMIQNCIIFLPLMIPYARLLRKLVPSRGTPPPPSFLSPAGLVCPERALADAIRELRRISIICRRSLHLAGRALVFAQTAKDVQTIRLNERIVNDVKAAMTDYLTQLARRDLSQRQAILLQHVNRCMNDLERIGDHIEQFFHLSLGRRNRPAAIVGADLFDALFTLYAKAVRLFDLVVESLNPADAALPDAAGRILAARGEYVQASIDTRRNFNEHVAKHLIAPLAGMYFSEYIASLDRIARHTKNIALTERQPQFWIKQSKLERHAELLPEPVAQPLVDSAAYLSRLPEDGP